MIRRLSIGCAALLFAALLPGCKAFRTLADKKPASQGSPYELVVICTQQPWQGALGDTLRSILTAPVEVLNQREPLFDVLRVTPEGFKNLVEKHRNIMQVLIDPAVAEPTVAVTYDLYAAPQLFLSVQGPSEEALTRYVSEHRRELLQVLEKAERDRSVEYGDKFPETGLSSLIEAKFGVRMNVPKGYKLRSQGDDFLWASYEYPQSSQGFFIDSYPYTGPQDLSVEALVAARNRFAARIPGPSDGSYMTTAEVYTPDYRMFRIEGRLWVELRGFWDVKGDFMGGPFVSYSTVDTQTGRVFTLDCYVYSPKQHKRNYLRGLEHLLYLIRFPGTTGTAAAAE